MASDNTSAGDLAQPGRAGTATQRDNPYPDEAAVFVRYPRDTAEEHGGRPSWPWLPGTVLARCGPDEWQICVEAREVAELEDGSPAPDGTPDDDLFYPVCFRDGSEIMRRDAAL